jgi:hypothetical protein
MDTPKQALDALIPEVVTAGSLALQPVSLAHLTLLQKLESPFATATGDRKIDLEAICQAAHVFAMPGHAVATMLANGFNRAEFDREVTMLSGRIALCEVPMIATAIARHVKEVFRSAVPTAGDASPLPGSPAAVPDAAGC